MRRTQPITKKVKFLKQPISTCYDGHMVNTITYFFRDSVEVLVQAVQQEDQQLLAVLLLERGKVGLVLPQCPPKNCYVNLVTISISLYPHFLSL